MPVEGIQTESGSQDTPTSEHSGLTIDEMENESAGSLSSIFLYSSFDSFSQIIQK